MRIIRWAIYCIAIVALADSYFWQYSYYAVLKDYENLRLQFYLQKDCDPGIAIPYPWSQPRGKDVI